MQVQVPVESEFKRPEDLAGKRIATSFSSISRKYFGKFDTELNVETQIKYVSGSVEAACSLGLADGIVDLVESGETMRAANLRPIGTILSTESVLICNHEKHSPTSDRGILINKIYRRFLGLINARKYVIISYNIDKKKYDSAKSITPGKKCIWAINYQLRP